MGITQDPDFKTTSDADMKDTERRLRCRSVCEHLDDEW